MRPHQSIARPLERATSHIKVTRPPCLFQLPPWENVNRSTTLIHCMWVSSFINYSWKKLRDFVNAVFPTTCNISYFVFELTICLLYVSLTTSHACPSGLIVAVHTMLQQLVNVSYVRYIACTNNLLSSVMHTCDVSNFAYVKALWRHFWSDDIISVTDGSTLLDYEQCGARMWARLSGAHSRSPNKFSISQKKAHKILIPSHCTHAKLELISMWNCIWECTMCSTEWEWKHQTQHGHLWGYPMMPPEFDLQCKW